jgi:hypothetical protein
MGTLNTMRILIVEDEVASITSARNLCTDTFHGCTMVIARTARELAYYSDNPDLGGPTSLDFRAEDRVRGGTTKPFQLILTDGWIPAGSRCSRFGPDESALAPNTLVPVGSIVALSALANDIPCILCTDSNGHHDIMGALLDAACINASSWLPVVDTGKLERRILYRLRVCTRPEKDSGGGKIWGTQDELLQLVNTSIGDVLSNW